MSCSWNAAWATYYEIMDQAQSHLHPSLDRILMHHESFWTGHAPSHSGYRLIREAFCATRAWHKPPYARASMQFRFLSKLWAPSDEVGALLHEPSWPCSCNDPLHIKIRWWKFQTTRKVLPTSMFVHRVSLTDEESGVLRPFVAERGSWRG